MSWMLTATGAKVDLRWIGADSISLLDIAHHLAQLNRYTGACSRPYSVAEHSLLVVQLLEHDGETNPSLLQAALMHDAHEAYTADLSTPMKQVVGAAWDIEESRVQKAVLQRFALAEAFCRFASVIKHADMLALSTERAQLLPDSGPAWPVTQTHPPARWVDLSQRAGFDWQDGRQAFLDKFAELSLQRAARGERVHAGCSMEPGE